jgi:cardiolipin synthase A/B
MSHFTHPPKWLVLLALGCVSCAGPEARVPPLGGKTETVVIAPQGALSEKAGEAALNRAAETTSRNTDVTQLLDAVRTAVGTPFMTGNAARALIDGPQALDAIDAAIAGARHHIHIETYIFGDDAVGRKLAVLLKEKRAAGVEVRVLYDAIGSVSTPESFFADLRAAGIEVLAYRPLTPENTVLILRMNNRDHRKIIVVDGEVGFTGGINISAAYSVSSKSRPGPAAGLESGWRDTHVRIAGPVVQQLQALFLATWVRAGGQLDATSPEYYPKVATAGTDPIAIVASDGDDESEASVYATYLAVVRLATRRIWLTQAYFAPNQQFIDALLDAVRRGVDVRVVVPGFTDSGLIFNAARSRYDELLKGGVRLYEQHEALVHAKTVVVDGVVSTVGSANLDMRSFIHNNEANALIVSRDFGQALEAVFERDLQASRELTLPEWRHRGVMPRLKESLSRLFSYWL